MQHALAAASAAGSSPCYAVLRLVRFPVLLEQFRNSAQGLVHLLCSSKFSRDIWLEHDHIGAFGILRGMFAPHSLAEVILRTHRVPVFRRLPSTLFLHSFFVRLAWPVLHL